MPDPATMTLVGVLAAPFVEEAAEEIFKDEPKKKTPESEIATKVLLASLTSLSDQESTKES